MTSPLFSEKQLLKSLRLFGVRSGWAAFYISAPGYFSVRYYSRACSGAVLPDEDLCGTASRSASDFGLGIQVRQFFMVQITDWPEGVGGDEVCCNCLGGCPKWGVVPS